MKSTFDRNVVLAQLEQMQPGTEVVIADTQQQSSFRVYRIVTRTNEKLYTTIPYDGQCSKFLGEMADIICNSSQTCN